MTATATLRFTEMSAPLPAMGTLMSAADQLFLKGTLVSRDDDGRAVVPEDGISANKDTGVKHDAMANDDTFIDHDKRANGRA